MPEPSAMSRMESLLSRMHLHSICESALCPNIGQCFERNTATFLILGEICTRRCTFCAVKKGVPLPVDDREPEQLLAAVAHLRLKHVVITSVTRDDLSDGGAAFFASVVRLLLEKTQTTIEVLIPDFQGSRESLQKVAAARPHVINHNLETVPRLYPDVRPQAGYDRSLELLRRVKEFDPRIVTKSGLMLGLSETEDEVLATMRDLRKRGCDLLTLGQYLQPSASHHGIARFIHPQEFERYETAGKEMGFAAVASAPLVRSSFNAGDLYRKAKDWPQ
ncbi:MAG: lipA2 [Deltaproteobacteria bacterium]|nr:lipA2 [Deltaproteobacteria bacterium]